MKGHVVRAAQPADLEAMLRIDGLTSMVPWSRDRLAASCENSLPGVSRALTVWQDECLAGFLVYSRVVDEISILNVAVDPAQRGRGRGRALLRGLLDIARRYGVRRLLLEVRRSNVPAIALYQRVGFTIDGVRRAYYPIAGGAEDALLMSCSVGEKK